MNPVAPPNLLYYGDNLDILRRYVKDESVDLTREEARMGALLTLHKPTAQMRAEGAAAGFYDSPGWNRQFPRLQIRSIAELMKGNRLAYPPTDQTFKRAPKAKRASDVQSELFPQGE